jgi:hypothetical protein
MDFDKLSKKVYTVFITIEILIALFALIIVICRLAISDGKLPANIESATIIAIFSLTLLGYAFMNFRLRKTLK